MSDLTLKILDPVEDLELFRESYSWRKEKHHTQPTRMSFESFASQDERQIVVGVFNGSFLAVFLLYEFEPAKYESHFTSKRGVGRNLLVEGGRMVRDAFLGNGAAELSAWIVKKNTALQRYLEALGFQLVESKQFPFTKANERHTVNGEAIASREFVKYAVKGDPP